MLLPLRFLEIHTHQINEIECCMGCKKEGEGQTQTASSWHLGDPFDRAERRRPWSTVYGYLGGGSLTRMTPFRI